MAKGETKVFSVMDKDGTITRLVEAQSAKQVKEFLLDGAQVAVASALTVARANVKVEKAE